MDSADLTTCTADLIWPTLHPNNWHDAIEGENGALVFDWSKLHKCNKCESNIRSVEDGFAGLSIAGPQCISANLVQTVGSEQHEVCQVGVDLEHHGCMSPMRISSRYPQDRAPDNSCAQCGVSKNANW